MSAPISYGLTNPFDSSVWTLHQWTLFRTKYADDIGTFSFSGDDWCNDGDGGCWWDGESRRCNCGNRRVYWCFDRDDVFPEAV